jgi:hypothetical protein
LPFDPGVDVALVEADIPAHTYMREAPSPSLAVDPAGRNLQLLRDLLSGEEPTGSLLSHKARPCVSSCRRT